ncbi:MAG TPA: glycosyltransferase family 87 protein [Verrucomicrobiae bacterium]|nr:glycosyltransferase family 87 protein [Verrucomicrobiae bacterium]
MRPNSTLLRTVTLVIAVALFVGLGISTVYRAGPYTFAGKRWGSPIHRCDFTVDTAAGAAVLNGTDIYDAHNIRGWYYIYPPLFAVLMVPFALLPTFWASLVWYVLSVILVAWTVWMCVSLVKTGLNFEGDPFVLYVIPPLLVLFPLMSALARGQTTPVLLWLSTAGLFYAWKGQDWRGGVCFAGGILLKVFPVVLLAYFVWRKRWRFVAATLTSIVIGALIVPAAVYGWQRNVDYLKEWVSKVGKPAAEMESKRMDNPLYEQLLSTERTRNQSFEAVLARVFRADVARPVAIGLGLAMAAAMLWVDWRTHGKGDMPLQSAGVLWMLLIIPISWAHYFMLLLLPLTVLVMMAVANDDRVTKLAARSALILYAVAGLALGGSKSLQFYGPLCWGALGVWVALLSAARRSDA